jgi:hypothetical protein
MLCGPIFRHDVVGGGCGHGLSPRAFADRRDVGRVVHNAYRIELSGESLRKRQAPEPAT